jgi:hypothetical protein
MLLLPALTNRRRGGGYCCCCCWIVAVAVGDDAFAGSTGKRSA